MGKYYYCKEAEEGDINYVQPKANFKTGEELELIPISCENKTTSDSLKELHYAINDLVFPLRKRKLSGKARDRIITRLTILGVAIKELQLDQRYEPKRQEILTKARKMMKALKEYQPKGNEREKDDMAFRVFAYRNRQFDEIFGKNISTEEWLKFAKISKELWDDYEYLLTAHTREGSAIMKFRENQRRIINMVNVKLKLE